MSEEAKPKIEGAKKFRRPMRAAGQLTKSRCDSQLHTERERWGYHRKGNQGAEPSNSASTRVPKGKSWGDGCRSRATGRCHGKEEDRPTQGEQEARIRACHRAVLARPRQQASGIRRVCASLG